MNEINSFLRPLFKFINGLGPNGWGIIAVFLVIVGVICMRGYGSRDTY